MDVTKPYEFIGFGAMDVTKPHEFIGVGAMDVTKNQWAPEGPGGSRRGPPGPGGAPEGPRRGLPVFRHVEVGFCRF